MKASCSRITLCALFLSLPPAGTTAKSTDKDTRSGNAARIVVKLRPALAAEAQAGLAETGELSTASASTRLRAFVGRHGLSRLRPVYEARVRAQRDRGVADRQLTEETRRRYPGRARRLEGAFEPPELSRTYVAEAASASPAELHALLVGLARDPDVEYAEEDKVVSLDLTPDDPYFASSGSWGQGYDDLYGLKAISAATAWDETAGDGIVVAVVDTGVDYAHPDLAANVWTNEGEVPGNSVDDDGNGFVDDARGWDFVGSTSGTPTPDADPRDLHGHGTHVAGTIAATGNNGVGVIGVAWKARVIAVKALDDSGSGLDSHLASAIAYAADNGADVINASWGAPGTSHVIEEAIEHATSLGVVFVAAAGNSAVDARGFYPAAYDDVITVAASDPEDALAVFSNWGPRIDVAAPGVDILSLRAAGTSLGTAVGDGYTRLSGTSMAAPHVAGLAALVLSRRPGLSTEQVRQAIRSSASDSGAPGFDEQFGYGRIDAAQAVLVDTPLEARILGPADGARVTGLVSVSGLARGTGLARFELAYGAGPSPSTWTPLSEGTEPVGGGELGTFDAGTGPDGLYTLRLTAFDAAGRSYGDRRQVLVDYVRLTEPAPPLSPSTARPVKPGTPLVLEGTATGPSFGGFRVEWAEGINPTSGWSASGVALEADGAAEIEEAPLATWDTSAVTSAAYYTLRLLVDNGSFTSEARTLVYLEPDLFSSHWPRVLHPGAWHLVGPHSVLGASGERKIAVTGMASGGVTLFRLSPDGSSVEAVAHPYGGPFQTASADLGGQPGDETILSTPNSLQVLAADGSSYALPAPPGHQFASSVAVVDDLEGAAGPAVLAVATLFGYGTGRLQAFDANGTPLAGAFPVAIADRNLRLSNSGVQRLLVADLDADGVREIVVAEGPTPTTFSLRLFHPDGSPKPWADPIFTGYPKLLAAADLDGDGTREVLVVETQATPVVHVLGADGVPRPGWPVVLPAGEPGLAVADLDRDGTNEVILSAGYRLYVLNADGQPFSAAWPRGFDARYFGPPVAADLDGDGRPEIVVATKGNAWAPDPLFPLDARGQGLRAASQKPWRPERAREPLAASSAPYFDYRLAALRGDGTVLRSWQLTGVEGREIVGLPVPLVTDVDGDGRVDIVLSALVVLPEETWVQDSLLTVLAPGGPYNAAANDWPGIRHDARNTCSLLPDRAAPVVVLTSPTAGATITGPTLVSATATDDVFVRAVQFRVDGVDLGPEDTVAPFEVAWDPRTTVDGPHVLTAVARDTAGNRTTSGAVTVEVVADRTPPAVSLTAPQAGSSVTGVVTLAAEATDDTGVVRVEFYAGGSLVAEDAAAPWSIDWDSLPVADGAHTLTARAYDAAANAATSAAVPVTVVNPPVVSITSPASGTVVSAPIGVTAEASDASGIDHVELLVDGVFNGSDAEAPFAFGWDPAAGPDGARTLVARAFDKAGHEGTSAAVAVTVAIPPAVQITMPASGSVLAGTVAVEAVATDNVGVVRVDLHVDGAPAGTDLAAPWSVGLDTRAFADGPHVLTARAYDAAGNVGISSPVDAVFRSPLAGYDPTLRAPRCSDVAPSCDSGALLDGRGSRGPEPNQPNTLNGSCADGQSGSYHADESNDRVRVATLDGSPMATGKTVQVQATVWAYAGYTSDKLDLFYAASAASPSWTLIGTFTPSGAGARTITASYTLPWGNLQAIRARFRYGGTATPCGTGAYNDHDDLVFAVASPADQRPPSATIAVPGTGDTVSAPIEVSAVAEDDISVARVELRVDGGLVGTDSAAPYTFTWNPASVVDGTHSLVATAFDVVGKAGTSPPVEVTVAVPPAVAIGSPVAGSTVDGLVTVSATASDNTGVSRVAFAVDGVVRTTDEASPYEFVWDTTSETEGSHSVVATAEDAAGLTAASAPVSVTVSRPGPGEASYDAVLKAPRCGGPVSYCDSGTLLVGRASRGPEPNAPNTLAGTCADGGSGSFHVDESSDRIRVSTVDGTNLAAGKTVRVEATVWAYSGFAADKLDLFYAASATSPAWTYLTTLTPGVAGPSTLVATYVLPEGGRQAVRAQFRYNGVATPCSTGPYDDHDDLVFDVE